MRPIAASSSKHDCAALGGRLFRAGSVAAAATRASYRSRPQGPGLHIRVRRQRRFNMTCRFRVRRTAYNTSRPTGTGQIGVLHRWSHCSANRWPGRPGDNSAYGLHLRCRSWHLVHPLGHRGNVGTLVGPVTQTTRTRHSRLAAAVVFAFRSGAAGSPRRRPQPITGWGGRIADGLPARTPQCTDRPAWVARTRSCAGRTSPAMR